MIVINFVLMMPVLGRMPLHLVSKQGHTEIVCLLLDNGADIDDQDDVREGPCVLMHLFSWAHY